MLYKSTGSHQSFQAGSNKEAVLLATTRLGQEAGGTAKLLSVEQDGNYSACVAAVTTTEKVWREGEQVEVEKTEQRRFMVKPYSYA